MQILERKLRILIRELLINENKSHRLNPKIKELVERFKEEILHYNRNLYIVISNHFPLIEVKLIEKSLFRSKQIGIVRFRSPEVLFDDNKIAHKISGKGPKKIRSWWSCGEAMEDSNLNIGPLLYEVAMEFICWKYKCAIMPDIRNKLANKEGKDAVSEDSYNVWLKYLERSNSGKEITAYQFDISKEEKDIQNKKDNTLSISQVTPEDSEDDFGHLSLDLVKKRGQEINGKKWSNSPLTKAFYKKQGSLITYLLKNPINGKVRIYEE